jgi:hypothetical protein
MNNRDIALGLGIGAALALMLDPQTGGRRRALVRDKVARVRRKTRDGVDAVGRDVANRTSGIAAATRARFSREEVDDARLVERVRARLGRVCSHPRAIDVRVSNRAVTLSGPILAWDMERVIGAVAAVRGVEAVLNELEPHESAAGIPSLQGEGRIAGSSIDILQRRWAPATQALVGVAALAATALAVSAARRDAA